MGEVVLKNKTLGQLLFSFLKSKRMKPKIIIVLILSFGFSIAQTQYTKTVATYIGDNQGISGWSFDIDEEGNIYIAGSVKSTSAFVFSTPGCHQPNFAGGDSDAFLLKLNPQMQPIWGTYFGGAGGEGISNIKINNHKIYFIGGTNSVSGISTPGAYQENNTTGNTSFLTCFDTNGTMQWSTYYNGASFSTGHSASGFYIDEEENIYVTSETQDTTLTTQGTFQPNLCGNPNVNQIIITKFSNTGFPVWCTYYSCIQDNNQGLNNVSIPTLEVHNNQLLVYGYTFNCSLSIPFSSTYYGTAGTLQPQEANCRDMFISSFNTQNGTRNWSTYYGGSGYENNSSTRGLIANENGIYFIISKTSMGMATPGAMYVSTNSTTPLLVKMNYDTSISWATYINIGNNAGSTATSLTFDTDGNLLISGVSGQNSDIAFGDFFQNEIYYDTSLPPALDGFIIKINSNTGNRIYGTYIGGEKNEYIHLLKKRGDAIYVCGSTQSEQNIATTGVFQDHLFISDFQDPYKYNYFAMKLDPNPLHATDFEETISADVYPTITNDYVNLNCNQKCFYEIYDILGKKLYNSKTANINEKIDLSSCVSGMYFISIQSENGTIRTVKKIIKR